ncbi:hypothetical protein LLG46_09035 [bacterium]|nr:hypothetical protein [bacterium]
MIKIDRYFSCLIVGLVLILGIAAVGSADAGLFGLFKSKKKASKEIVVRSLVIFPFDNSVGVGKIPENFGDDMASALRTILSENDQYWVYYYTDRLAPIKRAKDEGEIKDDDDATGPFTVDTNKCLMLAKLLAADYLLVGSVEDYRIDGAHKSAQLTVSVNIMSTKTGKVVKTLLVTGRTPEGSSPSEEEDARALAAGDVIAKLKAQLFEEAASPDASSNTTAEKKSAEPAPAAMPAVQTAR